MQTINIKPLIFFRSCPAVRCRRSGARKRARSPALAPIAVRRPGQSLELPVRPVLYPSRTEAYYAPDGTI